MCLRRLTRLVLLVADFLQPIDRFAIELLLNGDVGHSRGWSCTMPMFLAGCDDHNVAWPDLLYGTAPKLHAAAASSDDESLSERMGVPRRARSRFERHA